MDREDPFHRPEDAHNPACGRRELLGATVGTAAVAALPSAVASPTARANTSETAATAALQSADTQPVTLEGTVQTPPVSAGGRLLVGTTRGVYLFAEESLSGFVPTQPVRSIHAISDNLAVALLRDRFFPNVVAINPTTGEVRWSTGQSVSVYSQEFGDVDRQTQAYDAVGVGDVTGNGTSDVAVAAGYGVFVLDGETGELVWDVESDRYVWRVAFSNDSVYAGTQRGELLALRASDGTEQFRTRLADPYQTEDGLISRSVWDIAVADGIVVTTEDGYVKQVDPSDGSVDWERELLDLGDDRLSEYYNRIDRRPSMPTSDGDEADPNFFNLTLTPVEGGDRGFAVEVFEWVPGGEDQSRVTFLDANGQQQWTNESLRPQDRNLIFDADFDAEHVLMLSRADGGGHALFRLAVADGTDSSTPIPTVQSPSRRGGPRSEGFLTGLDGELVVAAPGSDLRIVDSEGQIQWGFPTIQERTVLRGDFLDTEGEDYLIASREQLTFRRGVESRTLLVRSGEDGTAAWSQTQSPDEFSSDGGLQHLRVFEGADGANIVGIEQPVVEDRDEVQRLERQIRRLDRKIRQTESELERLRDEDASERQIDRAEGELDSLRSERERQLADLEALGGRPTAAVVVRSGRDGSEQHRIPLRREQDGLDQLFQPTSLDLVEIDERHIAVVGTTALLLFVDVETGELLDGIPFGQFEGLPPFDSTRLDYRVLGIESNTLELLAIDGPQSSAAVVDVTLAEQPDVTQHRVIDLSGDDLVGPATETEDITDDGYDEYQFLSRGDGGLILSVVDPATGTILQELTEERGVLPTATAVDGSDGERTGLVSFSLSGEQFSVELSDGSGTVWRHDRDFSPFGFGGSETGYRPATPVGGERDLIALGVTGPEGGARVELYTTQDERVGTIPLESFRSEFDPEEDGVIPATRVERIPTDEGSPRLGVAVGSPRVQRSRYYVVDPVAEEKLARTTSVDPTGLELTSGVGVLGRDGGLTSIVAGGVNLADPSAQSTQQLEWTFETDAEYVTTVRVNQQPVAITTEQSTELRLPDGEHHIEVGARNRAGVTVYDSATASVSEGSLADLLLYAGSAISVLLLFAFSGVEAIRRRVQR
ncbi:outer membrane protein assembly factor BamB family protein [Halovenus sp. HT40]|uniref:outer membrane protein assembly factor BamB family protein n=1 Tax=Halovenus sp. HT40 TaxID=3126691 RepID=UPI00300F282E